MRNELQEAIEYFETYSKEYKPVSNSSKGEYLPTPMPKDCIAAPMNPWIRTNDQPPTEMDACHNGWVLALAAYQSPDNPVRLPAADIVDWNFPVNCPELYPYWMPLPKLPEVEG